VKLHRDPLLLGKTLKMFLTGADGRNLSTDWKRGGEGGWRGGRGEGGEGGVLTAQIRGRKKGMERKQLIFTGVGSEKG
jgi:hypothetical protein